MPTSVATFPATLTISYPSRPVYGPGSVPRYTLEDAITFRDAAKAAYLDALKSSVKRYGVGSRSTERRDLAELKREYDQWCDIVNTLTASGGTSNTASFTRRVICVD